MKRSYLAGLLWLGEELIELFLPFIMRQSANAASLPFQTNEVLFAVDGEDGC